MKQLLIFAFLFFGFSMSHPFYMSVCNIKYNADSKKMEGTLKMFSNDLEDALKRLENQTVDLMNAKNKNETLILLSRYLKSRLKFQENDKVLRYELLGYEIEEESIWVYFESLPCEAPKTLSIENSILYDFLKEQINILNLHVNGEEKSWKLSCPEKKVVFEF